MAGVALWAEPHRSSLSRTLAARSIPSLLELVVPALLLGLLRLLASTAAPRLGLSFTAEALLIAYAYFAVVRCVHVDARSRDATGHYSRSLALAAGMTFNRSLRRYWTKAAVAFLSLLALALALDLLNARTGAQHWANVQLTVLALEILVWARYGPAVLIAAARWAPPEPARFASARHAADDPLIARSFVWANVAFGVAALSGVAAYRWCGALLPSAKADLFCAATLFAAIALLALWTQCRWARSAVAQTNRSSARVAPPALRRAA